MSVAWIDLEWSRGYRRGNLVGSWVSDPDKHFLVVLARSVCKLSWLVELVYAFSLCRKMLSPQV
jgi:hypothetical protein